MYASLYGLILSSIFGLLFVTLLAILFLKDRNNGKKLPGPAWIPIFGNGKELRSDPDIRISLRRLQKKYGDIYKMYLGSNPTIIVCGYDAIKEIFIKRGVEFSDRPSASIGAIILNGGKEWTTISLKVFQKVMRSYLIFCFALLELIRMISGHGRLIEPPSRSSMWRVGYSTEKNYNDNQLFCGGREVQWKMNGGKCGICGDPWDGPRENEIGGKYAKGIIVRKYDRGAIMNVTVTITANHKGYFEFRLCAKDNPNREATQDCLDQNLLQVVESGSSKYIITDERWNIDFNLHLRLPRDVLCISCVLQWKYNTGNSWGTDTDGKSCIGCGPQEQFYGCSDIAIGHPEVESGIPFVTVNPNEGKNKDTNIENGNDKMEGYNCKSISSSGIFRSISKSSLMSYISCVLFALLNMHDMGR